MESIGIEVAEVLSGFFAVISVEHFIHLVLGAVVVLACFSFGHGSVLLVLIGYGFVIIASFFFFIFRIRELSSILGVFSGPSIVPFQCLSLCFDRFPFLTFSFSPFLA